MTGPMDPPTDPPSGPAPSAPEPAGEADASKPPPARPTPVRDLMGESPSESRPPPFREVELDERTWHVRVGGRDRSGTAPDHGASLLLLFFHRDPGDEEPTLEVLAAANELDELSDEQIGELAARARPYRSPTEARERDAQGGDGRQRRRSRRGHSRDS